MATTSSPLILSDHAAQIREKHGTASKKTRQAYEALHEADHAAQGARGLCFEWISSKIGTDADFLKLRDDAATKSAAYISLLDEQRSAQMVEMQSLHSELWHLQFAVNAIMAKLGINHVGATLPTSNGDSSQAAPAATAAA